MFCCGWWGRREDVWGRAVRVTQETAQWDHPLLLKISSSRYSVSVRLRPPRDHNLSWEDGEPGLGCWSAVWGYHISEDNLALTFFLLVFGGKSGAGGNMKQMLLSSYMTLGDPSNPGGYLKNNIRKSELCYSSCYMIQTWKGLWPPYFISDILMNHQSDIVTGRRTRNQYNSFII